MAKNIKAPNDNHIPFASRLEVAVCIALGCLNIALTVIMIHFFENVSPVIFTVAFTCFYLLEVAFLNFKREKKAKMLPRKSIYDLLTEESSVVFRNTLSPIVALDSNGIVLWHNDSMKGLLQANVNAIGENVESLLDNGTADQLFKCENVVINSSTYKVEGFKVSEHGDGLYIIMLNDITALCDVRKRYEDERVAVAYIAIDNVEDVLQYVHEKFRDAISYVEDKLKSWARSMNGIITSYDKDKYIMLFDSKHLQECIEKRFSILDEIRDTRVGDAISITVSIGVSDIKGTLAEREAYAKDAIDMALQRGGDQAVYRKEGATEYYGGRTKSVYKRSNVRSRTFTTQLSSLIARSDNVIVMGHRYGDFDSFGASLGIARLCMLCGVKTNIAIDMRDKNLEPCIELLQSTDIYSQVFVDNAEGLDLVGPDTLVILADHNTLARAQFSNIANKVNTVVVIDHHRTMDALPSVVKLSYIEPSASSTCELVAEMLENAISSQNLHKEVADMLLAGILLDTKQFTRNTGTRTFGVAQYLRGAGASPQDVYNLFKASPSDLSKEARFHTAISIYNGNIAISSCDGETDESYRVIASKAADKMLSLKGIDAAFTLVRIGEQVHISGRSHGTINVQLILERLNGGGHFDVAGAQIVSDSVESVLLSLKSSIDDYLDTLNRTN